MSTPYNSGNEPGGYEPYPSHPQGSHPENDAPAYGQYEQYGQYNNYGNNFDTNYGGDYSAYDVNSAASAAGASALRFHGQQLTDNVPGDGTTPHPINDPASNGWSHVKGTGRANPFQALGWGFKATFGNAKVWLVIGAIYLVLAVLLQFIPVLGGMLSSLAMIAFMPWVAGVALQQTLVREFALAEGKAPAYGKTLGVGVLIGFLATLLLTIFFVVAGMSVASSLDPATLPQSPEELTTMTADELIELAGPFLTMFGVALLLSLLVAPFFTLAPWYAADNNGQFGTAISEGFRAGARNFLPLLILTVLIMVINIVGVALAGLGLIVTMPAAALAYAYAYRQISAGPVPA